MQPPEQLFLKKNHIVTTTVQGIINLNIGGGSVISGVFADINWSSDEYFVRITVSDIVMGTSQLLSVPYALNAKTSGSYYIGQEKDGGIIFYLYKGSDGQEHGLIVAKTESTAKWQNIGTVTGATRTWDGAYNTNLMTDSPAKDYVQTLGSGWYIPSIDELSLLWHNRFHVNNSLYAGGFTLLQSLGSYFSSLEQDETFAYALYFSAGNSGTNNKSSIYNVRAIRAF